MPALTPGSNDSDFNLWRKILTNPGGTESYIPGEPEHSIRKKVLRNQNGALTPSGNDTERTTLRKILANQATALVSVCGASSALTPSSSDPENRLFAKLLINQNGSLGYVSGMADNPILRRILSNQAVAVDAAADEAALAQIRQVIGPCGGAAPGLTNYIEVPFYHLYGERVGGTTHQIWFQGTVQIWESGTVVIEGDSATNDTVNRTYEVWVGASKTVGARQVLGAAGANSILSPIGPTIISPGVGESVFFISGDNLNIGYFDPVQMLVYPGGWNFPITRALGGSTGSPASPAAPYNQQTITRSGNTITLSGDYVANLSVGQIFKWDQDESTFVLSNFVINYNSTATNLLYSYPHAIPAAPLGLAVSAGLAQSGSNQPWGFSRFGPIVQAAPTIQQGTDPG